MTSKFVVLAGLLAIAQSRTIHDSSIQGRIVGGHPARPGEFPHQASLQWGWPPLIGYQHFCGGTILDPRWILTAVHCLNAMETLPKFGTFVIKVGKHDLANVEPSEQMAYVESYYKHEKYNPNSNMTVGPYDIALVKLRTPLKLNKRVAPIKLPKNNSEPIGPVMISGWGAITNDTKNPEFPIVLHSASLPVVDRKSCNKAIEKIGMEEGVIIKDLVHETNICTGPLTGGISPCSGDSGSPLISKGANGQAELVGITSYAVFPCGRKGAPAVYVKVSSFIDWIARVRYLHG